MFMAAILLFLLSWLVPLHFLPWVSWHSEGLAFFAVFTSAWMMIARSLGESQKTRAIKVPLLIWPFVVLAVLAVVQGLAGLMPFWGDVVVIWFYAALCITCLTLGFATRADSYSAARSFGSPVTLLALAFVFAGVASTVVAFAQTFELWEHSSWIARMPGLRRPGGNLAQPNQLATLLLMACASVVFLYESKKASAALSLFILALLCLGLAVTESRTGGLSLAVLMGWWLFKRRAIGSHVSAWWAALVAGIFALFYATWPLLFNAFYFQTDQQGARLEVSDTRFELWRQMLEAVSLRPWAGWGIREVAKAHNQVADHYVSSTPLTYSHNFFLDLAVWVGVPLAVVFIVVGAVWLWRRVKMIDSLQPWYCLAVALPFAVHSQLEFPFAYAYFLAPVMFLLGYMEAALGRPPLFKVKLPLAAGALLVTSVLLVWSALEYFKIEEDFRIVRFEAMHIGQTPANYQKPDVVLLTQLGALLEGGRISPKPGMTADELLLAKKVALHYPWTATQNRYALSLALNGNPDEALRQLRVMRAMHGEKTYQEIKANWNSLAQDKFPQLRELKLP